MNKKPASIILTAVFIQILFLIGSCGEGNSSDDSLSCGDVDPDPGCSEDTDGDGLTYAQETGGWEVWPDRFGLGLGTDTFGQMDAHYLVKSDPEVADTDGDGLDDYEEYLIQSDPTMADTDEDGLTDFEEVRHWGTSALSVDTDGDSRGPDNDLSPNVNLFDGAELQIYNPSGNVNKGISSPVHSDTDGDGWSDYYELVEATGNGFLPAIADVPVVNIEISSSPIIRITGEYQSGQEWSRDVAVTNTLSQSTSRASSVSKSTELAIEKTHTTGVELGAEFGTDGGELHAVFSVSASYEFSHAQSTSTAHDVSWSTEQSLTAEEAYEESRGVGASEMLILDGGYVSVSVDLSNNGNVAFTLSDVRINLLARYVDGTGNFATVLELSRDDDVAVTLAPGQTVTNVLMRADTNDYQLLQALLKNQSGMMLEMASYSVTDRDGNSFGFTNESIMQKTAMVSIDYGGELSSEVYLVATNPSRSPDHEGITMATVMNDIINVPYETTEVVGQTGSADVLSAVRSVRNDASIFRAWLVSTSADMAQLEQTSFEDIILTAGDVIYLTNVKDEDSDGLIAREERLNGTSDADDDSDDDNLTDFYEVVGGWQVNIEGAQAYQAYSRGNQVDSDQDGLSDEMERDCGLDPLTNDTDLDGVSDMDELNGYDMMPEDTLVTRVVAYSGVVILDGGNGVMETTVTGDDVQAEASGFAQGDIVIHPGPNDSIDSTPGGDDFLAARHEPIACNSAGFASDPLNPDSDGDSIDDGVEREAGLGNPNDASDYRQYIDTDNDGLSDAVEELGFSTTINGSQVTYTSDPTISDTDSDGLPDLLERLLGSNPNQADTDGDSIEDLNEYSCTDDYAFAADAVWSDFQAQCQAVSGCEIPSCGAAPWSTSEGAEVWTDLKDNDSDDDRLSDGRESTGWTIEVTRIAESSPTSSLVTSNPMVADTDGDNLSDYDEDMAGSNPQNSDTDADGDNDNLELSLCDSSGRACRDPATWDRKVTVTYQSVQWDGNCDDWQSEHILIRLLLKKPGDNYYSRLVYDVDPQRMNQPQDLTYNRSRSFIAEYGDEFSLAGSVSELDLGGADSVGTGLNWYTDASLVFCPTRDCSVVLSYNGQRQDTSNGTEYTVGDNVLDTRLSVNFNEPGEACGVFSTYRFTVDVHARIDVE